MGLGGAAAIVRTCLRGACALGASGVELVTRGASTWIFMPQGSWWPATTLVYGGRSRT